MATNQTTIYEEKYEHFDHETGEIKRKESHQVKKSKLGPTDEFIKVSKYLNVIFAYNGIPLSLVPISLIIAQRMEFKTNIVYLFLDAKLEIGDMLGIKRRNRKIKGVETNKPDTNTVDKLINELCKYDILRKVSRGVYEVNSFLFSTGSAVETRDLQAHFDIEHDTVTVQGRQFNRITEQTVLKAVTTAKSNQIAGQLRMLEDGSITEE